MFLIRAAFWLTVVVAFIPADPSAQQHATYQAPSAIETLSATRSALADLRGMCERQPEVCRTGEATLELMGNKARNGARMVYQMLDENAQPSSPVQASAPAQASTLTASDRADEWRAPSSSSGV